jgi:hypothetical protein
VETIYFVPTPVYSLRVDPSDPLAPALLRSYIREHDGKMICIVFYPGSTSDPFPRVKPELKVATETDPMRILYPGQWKGWIV